MAGPTDTEGAQTRAEALCRQRGARLTPQRRLVLEIIAASPRPLGACEILSVLRERWPTAAPPTVYRALDFLRRQGLVHRLAAVQACVSCEHPDHPHAGQFLICSRCGRVKEPDDRAVGASLERAACAAGFRSAGEVVEITGRCSRCRVVKQP